MADQHIHYLVQGIALNQDCEPCGNGISTGDTIWIIGDSVEECQNRKDVILNNSAGSTYNPHPSHCCSFHGCKYGDANCPVSLGEQDQEHPCERCLTPEHARRQLLYALDELQWSDTIAERTRKK